MIKILIILPSLENKGPEIVARDIGIFSINKKIKYIYLSLRKNKKEDLENFKNFEVYEFEGKKIPIFDKRIKQLIKKINPTVIHCHCFWPTILAGIFLRKYKIVTTLHNNPLEDYTYEYGKKIGYFMTCIMLYFQKKFNMNIAISKYVEEVHLKLGIDSSKIITIYNGIDNIKYRNIENEKLEVINFITVSVLNERKNVEFLVNVIYKLYYEENIKNIKFKIIGNGPFYNKILNKITELKLENVINLCGNIKREEVYNLLKQSDIFLFSSKSEGFGLSVVEALKIGLPVITSNIPVMNEIIKNGYNGYICENNVDDYIEKIKIILENYNFFLEETRRNFNENYLAEKMSINYEKIYVELR
ncbi:glycosyltransferase [uncultured Cetobacterium sp.]|uniref:glycosyltransferase n=1 Tax=uncultured Cetobacterium sp. TaxID=527638 RepID=UPI0026308E20|nr:glycosyltransferase [uncultured Cetobacterium sp.]